MGNKKVYPDDEGELKAACYIKGDQIVISFGKSIKWLSLDEKSATDFINTLINQLGKLHLSKARNDKAN